MKKCPFCSEEIQTEAVKCRFCGEFLTDEARSKAQLTNTTVWPKKKVYLTICRKCKKEKQVDLIGNWECSCGAILPKRTETSTILEVDDKHAPLCRSCATFMEQGQKGHFGSSPIWLIVVGILVTLFFSWVSIIGWAIGIAGITMLIMGITMACRKDPLWYCPSCKTIEPRYPDK